MSAEVLMRQLRGDLCSRWEGFRRRFMLFDGKCTTFLKNHGFRFPLLGGIRDSVKFLMRGLVDSHSAGPSFGRARVVRATGTIHSWSECVGCSDETTECVFEWIWATKQVRQRHTDIRDFPAGTMWPRHHGAGPLTFSSQLPFPASSCQGQG